MDHRREHGHGTDDTRHASHPHDADQHEGHERGEARSVTTEDHAHDHEGDVPGQPNVAAK